MKARHWASLCLLLPVGSALFASGCAGNVGSEPLGWSEQAVTTPQAAECKIDVLGTGVVDLETNYIPHVITCEDGGAGFQALEAQAIAARSVAYYAIKTQGHVCDGQGCQVYSCGQPASALAKKAAAATAGMILSYNGTLTYGFFVAGDSSASPPSCRDYGGSTSGDVTYNQGLTGARVHQTPLGYEGAPGNGQNRGCMSQWGARCLENHKGYDELQILRFYYGRDIQVVRTRGACVPQAETLKAKAVRKWSNAARFHGLAADYLVCAGHKVKMSFTFKNTGTAVWRDVNGRGDSIGSDVFLVTASGKKDRFTHHRHYSVRLDQNSHVRGDRNAPNCSNRNGCRKTTFIEGDMDGRAPKRPGFYKTRWRLRDFSKAWGNDSHGFGPKVQIEFKVVNCDLPTGACGCKVTCNNGQTHQLSSSITSKAQCASAGEQYCRQHNAQASFSITTFKACSLPPGSPVPSPVPPNASGAASFDPGSANDPSGIGIDPKADSLNVQDDPGYSDHGFHGDDQAADTVPNSGCSVARGGDPGGAPL